MKSKPDVLYLLLRMANLREFDSPKIPRGPRGIGCRFPDPRGMKNAIPDFPNPRGMKIARKLVSLIPCLARGQKLFWTWASFFDQKCPLIVPKYPIVSQIKQTYLCVY